MKKMIAFFAEMNLPNKLTMLRMALVPVYLVLVPHYGEGSFAALIVFIIASLTDMLDGKIARKHNLITNFGKFMDPIADKLLTHTAFIMLCSMGRLNVVACIIFIAREFVVSGLRLVAVEQGHVIAAGMSGKIKTVLQMALVIVITFQLTLFRTNLWFVLEPLIVVLTLAAAALTLYSMIEYVWQNRAVLGGAK